MKREYTLTRDTAATAIPAGSPALLPQGTVVLVAQTLGGSVTVSTERGLFRIESGDATALGAEFASGAETGTKQAGGAAFSEQAVWDALKSCYDPEIPVNIVDLGLVYDLAVEPGTEAGKHRVQVKMTLTAPGCGMGPVIAADARNKILALSDVEEAEVAIVWDPVWTPQMISQEGRQILGLE